MIKLSPEQSQALMRLRGTPVLDYLESSYQALQDQLVTQTDVELLRRMQGQAQVYKHLIQSILFTGKHGASS